MTANSIRETTPRRRSAGGALSRGRPTWLITPAVVMLIAVVVGSELLGIWMAFFKIGIDNVSHWYSVPFAGISNFVYALTTSSPAVTSALHALGVSFAFAVLSTVIATPIGTIAAFTVHHRFRGRAVLRSWFLVPYVIPVVVTAMVGRVLFANGTGLVDQIMGVLGLGSNTYWLLGPNAFWAMVMVEVWMVWPFTYLMVLAALTSIPGELYEAVQLDGGGYRAKIRFVVLPAIRGVLLLSMVLSTIFHLGGFTLPYVMFSDPPPPAVAVLPINVYFRAFSTFQFGVAAATGVFMMIVFAIPAYFYIRATRLRQALGEQ